MVIPYIEHGCSVRAIAEVIIEWMPLGCSVQGENRVCVRGRTSVRARTEVCAGKTVIPWTIIYV